METLSFPRAQGPGPPLRATARSPLRRWSGRRSDGVAARPGRQRARRRAAAERRRGKFVTTGRLGGRSEANGSLGQKSEERGAQRSSLAKQRAARRPPNAPRECLWLRVPARVPCPTLPTQAPSQARLPAQQTGATQPSQAGVERARQCLWTRVRALARERGEHVRRHPLLTLPRSLFFSHRVSQTTGLMRTSTTWMTRSSCRSRWCRRRR